MKEQIFDSFATKKKILFFAAKCLQRTQYLSKDGLANVLHYLRNALENYFYNPSIYTP